MPWHANRIAMSSATPIENGSETPEAERTGFAGRLRAWRPGSIAEQVDHAAVLKRVRDEAGWSGCYAFMLAVSAGIAILGLLLSSPAVIIGAMLISPLMAPIAGLGFALATFDWLEVRRSLLALIGGTLLAIGVAALVVLVSPLKDLTAEMLARTRPNLFDLLVAVFAALAGGYAAVRGRGETIVGVAISTTLLPPLAVVGFGLTTQNMPVLGGAFALFLTNFIAIVLLVALIARLYGFGPSLSPVQTRRQLFGLVIVLLALAVPLAISVRQIAWETWATRAARNAVAQEFGPNSRIVSLDPNFVGARIVVRATVLTDRLHGKAPEDLERRLSERFSRPVQMQLSQVLVNQGNGQAELNRARTADAEARADQLARADMAARLSLVSGVPVGDVVVDSVTRVATVQVYGQRSLVDLMQAEARLAADSPGWSISLLPPPGPLPALGLAGVEPSPEEQLEAQAIAWALARRGTDRARIISRQLAGEPRARSVARANAVAQLLEAQGISVEVMPPAAADRTLEREAGLSAARAVQVEALAPSSPAAEPGEELEDVAQSRAARVKQA